MACEYCHGEGWHHPRCPLYEESNPDHYCSICKEGIYNGEEYIVNEDDEYAHFECVSYGKDMAEFLGYEIKEMNEENEKNFKRLKQLFGIYEIGNEYIVRLKDIKINPDFENSPPRFKKMLSKWDYYREHGEMESKIILNMDFELVDGYTSYIIAKKEGINKVPVCFVD